MSESIENMLQDCLEATEAGRSAEECLSQYPQRRDELAPLLRTAARLRSAAKVKPSEAFRRSAPMRMVGTHVVITERKRAEQALKESEERFRSLAEQSPNMIFINRKGKVVYANEKCAEIMGYKRKEFYSPDFDFLTLIAPGSIDPIKANFSKHMKGEEVPPIEYELISKEGKRLEAILATRLIRYGGESAILGIVTDITERRRAVEALKHHFERLEEEMLDERTKKPRDARGDLARGQRMLLAFGTIRAAIAKLGYRPAHAESACMAQGSASPTACTPPGVRFSVC